MQYAFPFRLPCTRTFGVNPSRAIFKDMSSVLTPVATAPTSLEAQVLARLEHLVQDGPSAYVCVRSRTGHFLNAMTIDSGLLAFPLQGRKRIREAGKWTEFVPGEIFLVPNARTLDIENIPDEKTGAYLAVGISLTEEVLRAARELLPISLRVERGSIAKLPLADHARGLLAWCDAIVSGDGVRAHYVLLGIVLSLYTQGYAGVLAEPTVTLASRIRSMVAANPAREWSSGDIENAMGMSGATLRRHLAEEGVSLRYVLIDARLSYALALLLTSRLPVKTVAARCGYASVSSFVKRFSERYGVEPSRVGGA
jgi:AraC-like DNA-binding protein